MIIIQYLIIFSCVANYLYISLFELAIQRDLGKDLAVAFIVTFVSPDTNLFW